MDKKTKWKKKWKKHKGEIIRTIIFFTILVTIFLVAAQKAGLFSINDLRNGVVQTKTEHEDGNYTFCKETTPDKVVDWIDSYSAVLTPVIDDGQAYYYKEEVTSYQKVMEYDIVYRTDRSYEEVLEFYIDHYPNNSEFTQVNDCAVMMPLYLGYTIQVKVEEVEDQVEVSMLARYIGG